jgi:hypothetical protein
MKKEEERSFVALTISVSEKDGTITTGLVNQLGEDTEDAYKVLLCNVIHGLAAMLRTDISRVGALGELAQVSALAEAMQEDILSAAEEEEDHPQMEVVFEPSPELEERIRKSGLH